MKAIVDDVGILISGGVLITLCARLIAGVCGRRRPHIAQNTERRQQNESLPTKTFKYDGKNRSKECQGSLESSNALQEPLLPTPLEKCGQKTDVYLKRNKGLAWSREVFGAVLFVIYFARGCMLLRKGDADTAGARLILVAGGWLVLSQLEEMTGLGSPPAASICRRMERSRGGSPGPSNSIQTPTLPQSPAWLSLWLGYCFYFGLAVHPYVVLAQEPGGLDMAKGIACVQLGLAVLVMLLLGLEAAMATMETRRLSSGRVEGVLGPVESKSARWYSLFVELAVPPSPEQKASLFSTLLFNWINPILDLGKQKVLALEDLFELEQDDRSSYIWRAFSPHLRSLEIRHSQHMLHRRDKVACNRQEGEQVGRHSVGIGPNSSASAFSGWGLLQALLRTYPLTFTAVSFFQLVTSLCAFGVPLSLKYIVDFIGRYKSADPIPVTLYIAATVLFLCPALAALANVQQFNLVRRLVFRCRAALVGLILRQTLRVDGAASTYSSGQIINHCTVDAGNSDSIRYLVFLWAVPLETTIAIALVFWVLRCWISGAVGVALIVFSVLITVKLSERLRKAQRALMKRKDVRISLLGEGLQGIRVLKLLAWERDFLKKLEDARGHELRALRSFLLMRCLISILWSSAPVIVSALTFLLHTMVLDQPLSASQGYATLALFGLLRDPLASLNTYLNSFVKGQVSLSRLERFLFEVPLLQKYEGEFLTDENDEKKEAGVVVGKRGLLQTDAPRPSGLRPGVVILNADGLGGTGHAFAWGESRQDGRGGLLLTGVRLHVAPGEFVCVYGPTGCGKSSLLMALLGELRAVPPATAENKPSLPAHLPAAQPLKSSCGGRVSYAAQKPWLLSGTIRDNILFGYPLDNARYEAALEACALREDLEALSGGDLTEIGEKGVTLSGGQQQRLSLCRAIYCPSDVVLLDDVLSAVDANVAQHLVRHCLTGPLLQGRTRILVTHQIALTLPRADQVLVLGSDSRVIAQGNPRQTPDMLDKLGNIALAVDRDGKGKSNWAIGDTGVVGKSQEHIHAEVGTPRLTATAENSVATRPTATLITVTGRGKQLIKAEQKAEGRVKWRVYLSYVQATGGFVFAIAALLTFGGVQALYYFQNKALGDWVVRLEGGSTSHRLENAYPYLYFSAANIVVMVLQALLTSGSSLLASRRIHRDMGRRVLRAPLSWFERTPLGRIQNRFSSDMDTIDVDMMNTLTNFLSRLAAILTITSVILGNMAPLALGMLPVLVISCYVGYTYQRSARELKRLDSVTRSPIYSHFSETVSGVSTLRAYGAQRRFLQESDARVDRNDRVYHHLWSANRWLAVRLQLLGAAVVGMVGVYLLLTLGSVPGQTAGLVLLFSSNFSENMNMLIRMQATLEMDVNSIERTAIEYTQNLEQEGAEIVRACRPPSTRWPEAGELTISHLRLRYPGTDTDTLRDVSFRVPPKTKVGVVGRTGAGKTSLIAALFRLVEPAEGSVLSIDGQDILKMGLEDLRGRLAIVPQESILFKGTVRSNLDPFGEFDDAKLWAALEKAQMKGRVVKSLDDRVSEGGENFSVGERALLCMGRALLRRKGVLILDEATASVDAEADAALQDMVRTELGECTVLAVAHRLKTVAYYDLVLVLHNGQVVEMGAPRDLLSRKDSAFRALAEQTGEFELLCAMAREGMAKRDSPSLPLSISESSERDGGSADGYFSPEL